MPPETRGCHGTKTPTPCCPLATAPLTFSPLLPFRPRTPKAPCRDKKGSEGGPQPGGHPLAPTQRVVEGDVGLPSPHGVLDSRRDLGHPQDPGDRRSISKKKNRGDPTAVPGTRGWGWSPYLEALLSGRPFSARVTLRGRPKNEPQAGEVTPSPLSPRCWGPARPQSPSPVLTGGPSAPATPWIPGFPGGPWARGGRVGDAVGPQLGPPHLARAGSRLTLSPGSPTGPWGPGRPCERTVGC